MSWLFSQALVAAYSADTCLAGEPSAPSSGNPIQQAYCAPDKMTAFSRLSRFGMTFKPLTEDRGADLLTSYLAASRARTSAPPEKAPASTEIAAACGSTWPGSFTKYDQNLSMWKTRQCSLLEDSEEFLETFPKWGLMHGGECWALPTSEHLTYANVCGLWPTPVKTDGFAVGWCETSINRKERGEKRPSGATIGSGLKYDRRTKKYLSNGYPNPMFTEWLMGWPSKWTDLQPLEMDKFREWQQQHSLCFLDDKESV